MAAVFILVGKGDRGEGSRHHNYGFIAHFVPSGASTRQLPLPLRLPPPHLHPRSAGPSALPGSTSFFLSSGEQEAKKGREERGLAPP